MRHHTDLYDHAAASEALARLLTLAVSVAGALLAAGAACSVLACIGTAVGR